jgi:excisionase family DNA binding protein
MATDHGAYKHENNPKGRIDLSGCGMQVSLRMHPTTGGSGANAVPQPQPPQPRLLTTAEAAQRLTVSTSTVRRWIREERLHAVRLGARLVRILESEVDAYIATIHHERETG